MRRVRAQTRQLRRRVFFATIWVTFFVGAACSEPPIPSQAAQEEQSPAAELQALREKAEQGDANAQFNLGVMYANGRGVPQDGAQAAVWWRKAAEQGLAGAQNNLGGMYGSGQGVAQDYGQAVAWFRKAADQGDQDGQFNLGMLYANGHGVPQDYTQAVAWWRKAAEQGDSAAQFALSGMYAAGAGVRQDYVEADMWRTIAAARATGEDQQKFSASRASLAQKMTPAQLAEAQKRATEWIAAFEKRKK